MWRPGIKWKDKTKPTKGQKTKRIEQKLKKSENKKQTSPLIDQVTRRNRGVEQPQWMEKSERTKPPCKKKREMWK
jgi:hypothetical protein